MAESIAPPPPPGFELEGVPQPPPGFVIEAPQAAKAPTRAEEMFADLQKTRGKDEPKTEGIIDKLGGRSGVGATAATVAASFLAPSSGGLSYLIPILAGAGGGALGKMTEKDATVKDALGSGAKEGLLNAAFTGGARVIPAAKKLTEAGLMKMFATRANAAEAGEGLLKRLIMPKVKAEELYESARKINKSLPVSETLSTLERIVTEEGPRAPTKIHKEILEELDPLRKYFVEPAPAIPSSIVAQKAAAPPPIKEIKMGENPGIKAFMEKQEPPPFVGPPAPPPPPPPRAGKSMKVADVMTEVERLRTSTSEAFKAGKTHLGNALNDVRASMLNDLEKNGAGIVKEAATSYRKEMAFEKLASKIAKSEPLTKIAELERNDKLFKDVFTPPEKEQIDRIVKKIATVAPTGASGVLGRILTGGMGAALGLPLASVGGPVVGALGSHVATEWIRDMFASPAGRKYIEKVLDAEIKFGTSRIAGNVGAATAMVGRAVARPPKDDQ